MKNRLVDIYVGKINDYRYLFYFDVVVNEVIDIYGILEKDIVNNGYKIYIVLD